MVITACYSHQMATRETPFGRALKYYREKERHLSQGRLAEKIGVSQAMVSKIETGASDGKRDTQDKILNYFNKSYHEFCEKGQELITKDTPSAFDVKSFLAILGLFFRSDSEYKKEKALLSKKTGIPISKIEAIISTKRVPTPHEAELIKEAYGYGFLALLNKASELSMSFSETDWCYDLEPDVDDVESSHLENNISHGQSSSDINNSFRDYLKDSLDSAFDGELPTLLNQNSPEENSLNRTNAEVASNIARLDQQHWKVVEQFRQKDKALKINQELVELEAMDPSELNGVLQYIEARKKIVAEQQEAAKKREAGNDQT